MTTDEKLAVAFLDKHPEVAARLLERMDAEQAAAVLHATPAEVGAVVVSNMLPTLSARCVERLSAARVAKLLEQLPVLTAAALVRHFPEDMRANVFRHVNPARTTALKLLLHYPVGAVGACMNPSVLTFASDYTVRQATEALEHGEHSAPRIHVLGRDRKPRGAVPVLALLREGRNRRLSSIIEPVETIWARESILVAQSRELWEREIEAAVVNRQGEFVGSVTFADLKRGQRSGGRAPMDESTDSPSDETLGELAELLWNGVDCAWSSLSEIAWPVSKRSKRNAP